MFIQHIRFAVRTLLKAPGFSAVAILVLALGIGANTAVFSLVNAMLLRPLPSDRAPTPVVGLYSRDRTKPDTYRDFSYPDFVDIRSRNPVFTDVTAATVAMIGYTEGERTRSEVALLVPANYFTTFGASVVAGRAFTAEEEKPGAGIQVAIVNYEYWKARGQQSSMVGSTVQINSRPFTVVGVAPEGFTLARSIIAPEFWLPTGVYEVVANGAFRQGEHTMLADRQNYNLMVFGRLRPGLTVAATEPLLRSFSDQLEKAYPAENKNQVLIASKLSRFSVSTEPQQDRQMGQLAVLLMAMTGIVLLIACLNLANMLMARATARRKEIAIRLALGSGRGPIIRQLLTEGMVLSLAGGAFGLLVAWSGARALIASIKPAIGQMLVLTVRPDLDARVLLVTLAFSVVSTLVFGLGPAWKLSRTDVVPELKEQGGETGRRRRWRFSLRNALVVGQLALSLALLTAAGLFVRGAAKASTAEPGFSLDRRVMANVDPSMAGYDDARGRDLYRQILERVRSLPGVESASVASVVPFGDMTEGRSVEKVGAEEARDAPAGTGEVESSINVGSGPGDVRDRGNSISTVYYVIGADYFRTLGIPILRGRAFTSAEEQSASGIQKAIIDQTLAERLFPKGEPLGQYIRFVNDRSRSQPIEIVGVAAPIRHNLLGTEQRPQVYVPFGQQYRSNMFLELKVGRTGSEQAVLGALPRELRAIDERLPVLSLSTLRGHRDASIGLWVVRTGAHLFTAFGLAAVFLALVGVYGVKAYLVSRRTREIGIRMSLGATPGDVVWLVVREGLATTAVGIGLGLLLAALVGMAVRSMLYQVSALDPLTFLAAPILLAAATLIACYFPARRAMKVAPARALRAE
jgi:predicted permease